MMGGCAILRKARLPSDNAERYCARSIQAKRKPSMTDAILDAKGLTCPLPILRAKKALKLVENGGVLTVLATDPSSVRDFKVFCQQTGNELVESTEDADGVFRYLIRKVL